jgi:NAD(P)H-dependent flavin oxidoreductase YrpB (nitropropane dioxygenase family)
MDDGSMGATTPGRTTGGRGPRGQAFGTRITERFGIRRPILAGGLMWLRDARTVAGIVNADGMGGFITSRSFATLAEFRAELAGMVPLGPATCFVERTEPRAGIVEGIIAEAVACKERHRTLAAVAAAP